MSLPPPPPDLDHELQLPQNSPAARVPHFAHLYRYLVSEILDHDASSKAANRQHQASGVFDQLKHVHEQRARTALVIRLLREICLDNTNGLPLRLRELILVICEYLARFTDASPDSAVDELMSEDIDEFRSHLDLITSELGQELCKLENAVLEMARLMHDSTEHIVSSLTAVEEASQIPSTTTTSTRRYLSRLRTNSAMPMTIRSGSKSESAPVLGSSSGNLISIHQTVQSELITSTLPTLLDTITLTLNSLLSTQQSLLTGYIGHLERHTHSTVSRNLTTEATFLKTVSEGIALKAQILDLLDDKERYAQEGVRDVLRSKIDAARHKEQHLAQSETDLRSLLREYELQDIGAMMKLGAAYQELEGQIEAVKEDIERLQLQRPSEDDEKVTTVPP